MLDGTQRRIFGNEVTDHHTGLYRVGITGLYDLARYFYEAFAFLIHGIGAVQLECQFACQHGDDDDSRMCVDRRGGPRRKVQQRT